MMNFRIIQDSIVEMLDANSGNCFRVVGHQRQKKAAEETTNNNRLVQVYYSSGEFPRNSGRAIGEVQHDITYRIELTVTAASEGDINTINDPNAHSSEKIAAMESFTTGAARVDESFDELLELVFQILLNAKNIDMGQPVGTVSNRWIGQIQKDTLEPRGEFVVLTGSLALTLRTPETILGEIPVAAGDSPNDITIDIQGDDNEKTGVTI